MAFGADTSVRNGLRNWGVLWRVFARRGSQRGTPQSTPLRREGFLHKKVLRRELQRSAFKEKACRITSQTINASWVFKQEIYVERHHQIKRNPTERWCRGRLWGGRLWKASWEEASFRKEAYRTIEQSMNSGRVAKTRSLQEKRY